MKNLLTVILLVIIHFGVLAQNEVFRIDSLPQKGIMLDKGWKWHAGDNPDFAKPEFDDRNWKSIDPTQYIDELPQIKKAKIGWFRIHINVDSSLKNTILSLQTNQVLAAEFYQNGAFFGNMGIVSRNPKNVQGFFSFEYYKPVIHLYTGDKTKQVLAVRFAYQDVFSYQKSSNHKDLCLAIKLSRTEPKYAIVRNAFHENNYEQRGDFDATSLDFFKAGLYLILSILHLCFYFFYRFQKANLFFGLGCLFLFIFYLYQAIAFKYFYYLSDITIFSGLYWFIRHPAHLFQLVAVYLIFSVHKGFIFKILIGIVSVFLFIPFFNLQIPFFTSTELRTILSTIIFLDVARVSTIAWRSKKDGSWIIFGGSIIYVIFTIASNFPYESAIPRHIITNIGTLSVPISITLFLAREFAQTSISLKSKLIEVQQLSNEKQETLQKLNSELQAALLKGQTIERHRVAADLHDNLGSTLSALWLSVDTIDKSKMNDEEKAIHQNLRENLEKAYNDVRLLSHNLLPEEFEKQGLKTILQGFIRKMNKNSTINFNLKIDQDFGRVDNKIEFELYSICLELVNNIMKHSKASEAKISLSRTEKQISLIVSDNGIGVFKNDSDGKGMKNVKARVESLNGKWELMNVENQGVINIITVDFNLPNHA